MPTDKERMDWFEEHKPSLYRRSGEHEFIIVHLDTELGHSSTFRRAIDAAMKAERTRKKEEK